MTADVFLYQDSLARLSEDIPLLEKFDHVRGLLNRHYPFITRIAAALYDPDTDLLKTFIHSSDDNPLQWYEARLSNSRSLTETVAERRPRVINDLGIFSNVNKPHTQAIAAQGYEASYTLPVFNKEEFIGFVFFNSVEKAVFRDQLLLYLDSVANLLSQSIVQQMMEVRTLLGAVKTVQEIAHQRDNETGDHLKRMACYARMIALELAPTHKLSDEFVEYMHLFAPLHDVGKIAIPDDILLKPGPLTDEEYAIMQTHTREGRKIVESMLEHFRLRHLEFADMLISIVEDHHEKPGGGGYIRGLKQQELSLAARIVSVADVFDALTSARPYKEAWDNEKAVKLLRELAGDQLDAQCVEALCTNMTRVEEIQCKFAEGRLLKK